MITIRTLTAFTLLLISLSTPALAQTAPDVTTTVEDSTRLLVDPASIEKQLGGANTALTSALDGAGLDAAAGSLEDALAGNDIAAQVKAATAIVGAIQRTRAGLPTVLEAYASVRQNLQGARDRLGEYRRGINDGLSPEGQAEVAAIDDDLEGLAARIAELEADGNEREAAVAREEFSILLPLREMAAAPPADSEARREMANQLEVAVSALDLGMARVVAQIRGLDYTLRGDERFWGSFTQVIAGTKTANELAQLAGSSTPGGLASVGKTVAQIDAQVAAATRAAKRAMAGAKHSIRVAAPTTAPIGLTPEELDKAIQRYQARGSSQSYRR